MSSEVEPLLDPVGVIERISAAHILILLLERTSMREKIDQEVSVVMYYSAKQRQFAPHLIDWQNKQYHVGKIGYHHAIWEGRTLHHIFELVDREQTLWFRLDFDTSNLHWRLEAISDGHAN